MPAKTSYQTKGIVIGRTNFGEADRVIRFITPEHGKIAAMAKGVRKIKSRSGGHLELLGEVTLMLIPGKNLETVTTARLLWYPHDLVGDYGRLGLAFAMAKAADRLTEPGHATPGLYNLLRQALGVLDAGAEGPLIELWYKLRLLEILGYRPELTACIACGRHSAELTYAFSPERGGIVCHSDAGATDIPMTTEEIKFCRLLSDYNYGTIVQIAGASSLASSCLRACDLFYEHHLGNAFKPSLAGDTP